MSQTDLANHNNTYKGEKGHFRLEIQLLHSNKQPFLKLKIQNTQNNKFYSLQLDKIQIIRDKVLGNIFRNPQELYQELVSGFQEISIEEHEASILIKYQVKLGKFRKELITLQLKKISQKGAEQPKVSYSPPNSKKKVFIDKAYVRDLTTFKQDFNKICDKIANKEFLAKMNVNNDRNNRIKIKNVFIAFANTILRSYRKCIQFTQVQATEQQYSTQPPNKLLIQKNELLQNILLKAIKRNRQTPTQEIEIDFMPQIPAELIVVTEDDRQVPLSKYLTPFPVEQIQRRVRFHQKKQEKLANSFNIIHQKKRQRLEEMNTLFEGQRKSNRLSINGKRSNFNPSDAAEFDQF